MNAEWKSHHQGESSALGLRSYLKLGLELQCRFERERRSVRRSGVSSDMGGRMRLPQNSGSVCLEQRISVHKQWGGGPGVKISPSSAKGTDSIPAWEAKVPRALGSKN